MRPTSQISSDTYQAARVWGVSYGRAMTSASAEVRDSRVDRIANTYLERRAALDPIMATNTGLTGYDHLMPDLSPDGCAARAELDRATLDELSAELGGGDQTDRITVAALRERLGLALELYEAGEDERDLNVIASAPQSVRSVFDLMDTATPAGWATIATRLDAVPATLAGYTESLRLAASRRHVAARRQVEKVADECEEFAGDDGFFARFVADAPTADLGEAAHLELNSAGTAAAAAYQTLADFLRTELLPHAPEDDAVGRDRYALASRVFLGAQVDLDETYQWGLAELDRIEAEMAQVADQIVSGGDVDAAVEALDADPVLTIHGKEAFRDWMQEMADKAVSALAGSQFDIPETIRRIDCKIAPTTSGGIYYTGPSEDFIRPGAMWWAVPKGVDDFSTWRELTVVYHDGVPGHHLQIAQTAYRRDILNRWRRFGCWASGHGEGWALYAERLMAELGFLEEPGPRLGMLDSQAFRATRVVVDIGVHLGLAAPDEVGGGTWDADKAWRFLRAHTRVEENQLRFELDRYLGWPGQAPSYKLGERIWLQLRDEVRQSEGDAFELAAFHRRALDLGSVGLDVLRDALLR
jgi:uncharacterized protein (DUF885 family)